MTETQPLTNQKRLPHYYVLQYQHRQHYSIYGNVDYGTKAEGELERLQERAKELALQNPWLKYWVASDELSQLFSTGLKTARDRALFGVCLYTGTRIAEACSLHTKDVYAIDGSVRPRVTIRKGTTKGKIETRSVPVNPALVALLSAYSSPKVYLFPGRHGLGHIHPDSADKILRAAFINLGIEGASTHSFRRTCLTQMHRSGVPLKVIQKISGHKTLSALQKYLEILDEDLDSAIATLTFGSNL